MPDSPTITIKLTAPFNDVNERRIEALTFRKGRLGDMYGIEIGGGGIGMDKIMLIASRLSGESLEVIKRLEEGDAGRVVELALGFIGRCLRTGGELSP